METLLGRSTAPGLGFTTGFAAPVPGRQKYRYLESVHSAGSARADLFVPEKAGGAVRDQPA